MSKPFHPNDGQAWLLVVVGLLLLAWPLSWLIDQLGPQWQRHGSDISLQDVWDVPTIELFEPSEPAQPVVKNDIHRLPSQRARKIFAGTYAQAELHRAIAVSDSGYWGYATRRDNPRLAARSAMWFCERYRRKADAAGSCQVVHIDTDWLSPQADQSGYQVDPALIALGIMPDAEVVLSGVYANAPGYKALASSKKGYFGYAYRHDSPEQAAQAALAYCNGRAKAKAADDCIVRVVGDDWVDQ